MEKILQADKFVSSSQPQIGDSKIYSGDPVPALDAGQQFYETAASGPNFKNLRWKTASDDSSQN